MPPSNTTSTALTASAVATSTVGVAALIAASAAWDVEAPALLGTALLPPLASEVADARHDACACIDWLKSPTELAGAVPGAVSSVPTAPAPSTSIASSASSAPAAATAALATSAVAVALALVAV